jgi:hypothetical protein
VNENWFKKARLFVTLPLFLLECALIVIY